jgi:hypothetical protein
MNSHTKYGLLGYFDLIDWYNSTFDKTDKDIIKSFYRPMGWSYDRLVSGSFQFIDKSGIWALYMIAGHLINRPQGFTIAFKLLTKAEQIVVKDTSVMDQHFLFLSFIKLFKSQKNKSKIRDYSIKTVDIAENVVTAYKKEYGKIDIAHPGYIELISILLEEKNFDLARHYTEKAINQGWKGPWMSFIKEIDQFRA